MQRELAARRTVYGDYVALVWDPPTNEVELHVTGREAGVVQTPVPQNAVLDALRHPFLYLQGNASAT